MPFIPTSDSDGAAIYDIPESSLVWICPCLEIAGLVFLFAALLSRRKLMIIIGVILLASGAVPERDISLLIGGSLYGLAILIFLKE